MRLGSLLRPGSLLLDALLRDLLHAVRGRLLRPGML